MPRSLECTCVCTQSSDYAVHLQNLKIEIGVFIKDSKITLCHLNGVSILICVQQAQADWQVALVNSMDQLKKARKGIPDIHSWVEAFGGLVAVVAVDQPPVQHMSYG